MAQPMTTAAGNNKASWMRLSIRTNDCSGLSLDEDFSGGEGRFGWSDGIGIGASYTPRVALVGQGATGFREVGVQTGQNMYVDSNTSGAGSVVEKLRTVWVR
jgi:hypothetical protein